MPAGDAGLLRRTELFGGLDDAAAERVAERLVRRTYRKGQPLFYQGDAGDALYVVVDGAVAVVISNAEGDRVVLRTLAPFDTVGELALLDDEPRSATAEAVEPTAALVLSRAAFLALMHEHPLLVDELLRSLGGLVRRLSEQTADFVFLDLAGRVAKALVRLAGAGPHGDPVEVRVTQGRLAEMAGGSRQSVNQIVQSFAGRGWLEVQGRGVLVHRLDMLRQRSGSID